MVEVRPEFAVWVLVEEEPVLVLVVSEAKEEGESAELE